MIVHKHAYGIEPCSETNGLLIQMRLEKPQMVTRSIRCAEKFAVVFFCAEDCDFHRLISAFALRSQENEAWQQLRVDAHFFIPGLADSSCKDEHFFKAPRESR
jgi:hypothetical protein